MDKSDREQHDQFLRLFIEHEEMLRLFVRSLLFSGEESREVMQEVAIVLWRKFDSSLDRMSFRRWAFGVARMEALAFRRDRARDRHLFGDDVAELLGQEICNESKGLERQRNVLETCVEKLRPDQRELLQSAYQPGAKMKKMAEELKCTSMTLYKKLHRIRMQLMECTQRELAAEECL
ncbi:sigma-70 family RNA polymerase sigma factor [Neorhodopirellula lusitana]